MLREVRIDRLRVGVYAQPMDRSWSAGDAADVVDRLRDERLAERMR